MAAMHTQHTTKLLIICRNEMEDRTNSKIIHVLPVMRMLEAQVKRSFTQLFRYLNWQSGSVISMLTFYLISLSVSLSLLSVYLHLSVCLFLSHSFSPFPYYCIHLHLPFSFKSFLPIYLFFQLYFSPSLFPPFTYSYYLILLSDITR